MVGKYRCNVENFFCVYISFILLRSKNYGIVIWVGFVRGFEFLGIMIRIILIGKNFWKVEILKMENMK